MAIKKHKPTCPGRRFSTWVVRDELTRDHPEKSLVKGKSRTGGRNTHGRITSRHRGGGAKRKYRLIDFKRRKDGVPASVAAIEYDPNRSAHIALLHYLDGEKRYILAPQRLTVGMEVVSGERRRHPGRQLPSAPAHPDRYGRPQRRDDPGPRRPDGPLRRRRDSARRQGGVNRDPAPALGRDAHGGRALPRHDRVDRQHRPRERDDRKGRPEPSQGHPAPDARNGHEPCRPPARRRRGQDHSGRHPVTPWGVPTLGYRTRKKRKPSDRMIVRGRKRGKKR